ncbi:MAG TPA: adenylate kinase [Xanthomonadaceae bacterium]|nr:adenylate kinase [Xanthomonadaceae bacterium]
MRLVLLGAPGSGKGTQAARLKEALGVPHISTGEMLRAAVAAGTPIGVKVKEVMAAGQLVSDELILGMLEERLGQGDVKDGFILDGYPRNLVQCEALEALLARLQQPVDMALLLEVPTELLVERLAGRAAQEGRTDDNPESVRQRLRVYDDQTAPVIEHFHGRGRLLAVNGVGSMDQVFDRSLAAIRAA